MVGLDDVFTVVGLKEDSRSKDKISTKASQCVDDYIEKIPDVEKDLEENLIYLFLLIAEPWLPERLGSVCV